jgi:hypothetical protein
MGQKHFAGMAVVGVVAAGVGGIIGIISLLDAIGVTHGSGSTAHYTVLAVLGLGIAVIGAGLAIYGEHQVHHLPGGRSAWAANEGWRTVGQGRLRVVGETSGSGRRRVHTPGAAVGVALITTAMACIGLVGIFAGYSGAQRSSYTQSHGVSETAVADNVQNIASHSSHGGTTYTSQITVTIQHPAVGDGSATVYGNGRTSVQPGDTLTVLVDPKQPSYAEFPGVPYDTTSSWVLALVFTLVVGCIAGFAWRNAVLMLLRHRRVSLGRPYAAGV